MRKFDGEKYIGRTFERLKVLDVDKNKPWHVICQCKCGTIKSIKIYSLLNGATTSCGCLHLEKVYKNLTHSNKNWNKANITRLKNNKLTSRNKTGVRGVCYLKDKKMYRAYISINGKRKYLGDFNTLDEATAVRKNAEIKALEILNNI